MPISVLMQMIIKAGEVCDLSSDVGLAFTSQANTLSLVTSGGASLLLAGSLIADNIIPGGELVATVVGELGEVIYYTPSLVEKYLIDKLPKVPKPTFKQLRELQQANTEEHFLEFNKNLARLPPQHAHWLKKLMLGNVQKNTSKEASNLATLKQIGIGLRNLSEEDKRKVVFAFTSGCKNFNASLDSLLSLRLPNQDLFIRYRVPEILQTRENKKLLEDPTFPDNVDKQKLISLDPETLALCSSAKFHSEIARIESEIKASNQNAILTQQEIAEVDTQFKQLAATGAAQAASYKHLLEERCSKKILSRIDLKTVISKDVSQLALHLQTEKSNHANQTEKEILDDQLEQLIEYLNTNDCNDDLAKRIDEKLDTLPVITKSALKTCYEKSMDAFFKKLGSKIDRGSAKEFYDAHLAKPQDREKMMAEFNFQVENPRFAAGAREFTGIFDFPLAKVALLAGMLDNVEDKQILEAYQKLLQEMTDKLRLAIIQCKDPELSKQFDASMELLGNITLIGIASRGERLEQQSTTKNKIINALNTASRISLFAAKVGALTPYAPGALPVFIAISAILGTPGSLVKVLTNPNKRNPEAKTQVMQETSVEVVKFYESKCKQVETALQNQTLELFKTRLLLVKPDTEKNHPHEMKLFENLTKQIEIHIGLLAQLKEKLNSLEKLNIIQEDNPLEILIKSEDYRNRVNGCLTEYTTAAAEVIKQISTCQQELMEIEKELELENLEIRSTPL